MLIAVDTDLGGQVFLNDRLPLLLPLFRFVFSTSRYFNLVLVVLRFWLLLRAILLIIVPRLIHVKLVAESVAHTHVKELSLIHRLVHILALLLGPFGLEILVLVILFRLRGFRGFFRDLMRWLRFLDDSIVKVIVFPMSIDFLLLILILVDLKICNIFGSSQSIIRYRITVGSTYMTLVSDLSCFNLQDLVRIDLIDVGGITLNNFNQERVPATLQLL